MPWNEVNPMDEKIRFVLLAKSGRFTMTELCHDFGISRKTGHKYLNRYELYGAEGLHELSRAPQKNAKCTDDEIVKLILKIRRAHTTWGGKKLYGILHDDYGVESPPCIATINNILKRHGLVKPKRRKPGAYPASPSELTQAEYPNHVWTIDFKGWFILGNAVQCEPLTVKDLYSRLMIGIRAQDNQRYKSTTRSFRCMARANGLPRILRADCGSPWASPGLGRLSRFSILLIEQGVAIEFTRPGHPQDNGSHERMHRDLKAEATSPPSKNLRAQQRRFDRWVHTYNYKRPHEALGGKRPAQVYHPSEKRLGEKVTIRYPKNYIKKRVSQSGFIAFEGKNYYAGEHFAHCTLGLYENEQNQIEVHYANLHLGNLAYDSEGGRFRPTAYIAPLRNKSLDKANPT